MTQTITVTVTDEASQKPIAGVSVIMTGTKTGTITDDAGNFRINNVSVGKITLIVSYVGYKDNAVAGIIVNAGKEIVLNAEDHAEIVNLNMSKYKKQSYIIYKYDYHVV